MRDVIVFQCVPCLVLHTGLYGYDHKHNIPQLLVHLSPPLIPFDYFWLCYILRNVYYGVHLYMIIELIIELRDVADIVNYILDSGPGSWIIKADTI